MMASMDAHDHLLPPVGAPAPPLAGTGVRLRPVLPEDVPVLAAILAEPSVARWWPGYDEARVEEELLTADAETTVWVIEALLDPSAGPEVVGAIEAWEEPNEEYRHAGIDLFLAPAAQGRRLGPGAVRVVARWLIGVRGHHRLTIDPAADNERAIRAYTALGFRPVGRLRRYQRMPDATWADGLLMELLAGELVG
jgi:aminoglycoside 6'-N-acetyltransferase